MCAQNALCETRVSRVEDADDPADAFHLDPARRDSSGTRSRNLEDFLPPVQEWKRLTDRYPAGCIKLNPGISCDDPRLTDAEIEIVSENGNLTQALLWTGQMRTATRRATRISPSGESTSLAGEPARIEDSSSIQEFIATIDPSIERADLLPALIETTNTPIVCPGTGLVTSPSIVDHPMLTWFHVLDVLRWNRNQVKSAINAHAGGIIEVKTRAGFVDPDTEQLALRGAGDRILTAFVYLFGKEPKCVLCERVHKKMPQTPEGPTA